MVISSETSELMGICDRILVMRKGQIQGELAKRNFQKRISCVLSLVQMKAPHTGNLFFNIFIYFMLRLTMITINSLQK